MAYKNHQLIYLFEWPVPAYDAWWLCIELIQCVARLQGEGKTAERSRGRPGPCRSGAAGVHVVVFPDPGIRQDDE